MSNKFRVDIPKELKAKPEEQAALAILIKRSLGKKVHKVIKDEKSLLEYYDMVMKLAIRPVYRLDFEGDIVYDIDVVEDVEKLLKAVYMYLALYTKIVVDKIKRILRKRQ